VLTENNTNILSQTNDLKKLKIGEKTGKLSNFKPPFVWKKSNKDYEDTVKNPAVTNNYVI